MVVDRDFLLKVGLDLVHSWLGCIVIGCHDWHTADAGWNDVQRELWLKFWRRLFQINIDNLFARRLLKVFVEVKWGVEKPLLVRIIILGFIFVDVLFQAINGNYSVSIFRSFFVSFANLEQILGFVSSILVRLLISAVIALTSECDLGKILIKFVKFLVKLNRGLVFNSGRGRLHARRSQRNITILSLGLAAWRCRHATSFTFIFIEEHIGVLYL